MYTYIYRKFISRHIVCRIDTHSRRQRAQAAGGKRGRGAEFTPIMRNETEFQGGINTNTSTSQPASRVVTCDASLSVTKARALSYRLFVLGFFLLPWAWMVNAWLFKHHIQLINTKKMTKTASSQTTAGNTSMPRDGIVGVYASRSFVLAAMSACIFVTWLIVVHTAGGARLRDELSLRQLAADFRQI